MELARLPGRSHVGPAAVWRVQIMPSSTPSMSEVPDPSSEDGAIRNPALHWPAAAIRALVSLAAAGGTRAAFPLGSGALKECWLNKVSNTGIRALPLSVEGLDRIRGRGGAVPPFRRGPPGDLDEAPAPMGQAVESRAGRPVLAGSSSVAFRCGRAMTTRALRAISLGGSSSKPDATAWRIAIDELRSRDAGGPPEIE